MKIHSFYKICFVFALVFASCKSNKEAVAGASKNGHQEKGLSDRDLVQFKTLFFNANRDRIKGDYDLAETEFSQALKIDPACASCMYELSGIYSFQNNKKQALFYSKNAAAIDPKNIWYELQYALCLKERAWFLLF